MFLARNRNSPTPPSIGSPPTALTHQSSPNAELSVLSASYAGKAAKANHGLGGDAVRRTAAPLV